MVAPAVVTAYLAVLFAETPATAPTPDFVGLIPEWRFVDTLFQDKHRSGWATYQEAYFLGLYLQRSWGELASGRATGSVLNYVTAMQQFDTALRYLDTVHVSQSLTLADVLNRYRFHQSAYHRLWVVALRGFAKGLVQEYEIWQMMAGWERLRRSYLEWFRRIA